MEIIDTKIPDVKIFVPRVFYDDRGHFFQVYTKEQYNEKIKEITGHEFHVIQENESNSKYGVIRGIHMQRSPYEQAKLIRVAYGKIILNILDMRKDQETFGNVVTVELSGENKHQAFVPRGLAIGFSILEEGTIYQYSLDNKYNTASETGIRYDDPDLNIKWGLEAKDIIVSEKDKELPYFKDIK